MTLMLVLTQAAVASLPVASAPAPAQQGVSSFTSGFFATLNASNALDMANKIPGFTLDTGAAVRGYEGAAGNILINGQRPSSKADSVDQILQRIPIGQVERIDVIRGGAPGIDMQGKTVIANVILKSSGGIHGLAAVAAGFVVDDGRWGPSLRLEASGGTNGRAWEASVRAGRGIDDGSGPGAEVKVDPAGNIIGQNSIASQGQGDQTVSAGSYETPLFGGQFRINGRYFTNRYDYNETDVFVLPPGLINTDHQGDDETDTEVGGRYNRGFGPGRAIEIVGLRTTKDEVFADNFASTPGERTDFLLDRYSTETIGRAALKLRQSDTLSWEGGAEAAFNSLDSRTSLSQDGAPIAIPAANVRVEEKRWEAIVKATWHPNPKLTVEASVRQEGSTIDSTGDVVLSKKLTYTKPRLSVAWDPRPNYELRFRVEREVGQLNFDDFVAKSSLNTSTVTAGNPDLNPEQAWVVEGAIERHFWGAGAVTFTARHYKITGVVDRAPIFIDGDFFDAPANIGDGTKDELSVELTLPLDKLHMPGAQLKGNVTRRFSEVTDPSTLEKREISNLRPVVWEAHFSQPLPRWKANWGIDAFGGWRQSYYRTDVIEDQKLKTYVVPFIEWKPRPDIQVHFEMQNFTRRGFRDTRRVFPGPRGLTTFTYVDDRDVQFGQIWYLRVRKYFGT